MASIEDSGSFDHSSNLCGTKLLFILVFQIKKKEDIKKAPHCRGYSKDKKIMESQQNIVKWSLICLCTQQGWK